MAAILINPRTVHTRESLPLTGNSGNAIARMYQVFTLAYNLTCGMIAPPSIIKQVIESKPRREVPEEAGR